MIALIGLLDIRGIWQLELQQSISYWISCKEEKNPASILTVDDHAKDSSFYFQDLLYLFIYFLINWVSLTFEPLLGHFECDRQHLIKKMIRTFIDNNHYCCQSTGNTVNYSRSQDTSWINIWSSQDPLHHPTAIMLDEPANKIVCGI